MFMTNTKKITPQNQGSNSGKTGRWSRMGWRLCLPFGTNAWRPSKFDRLPASMGRCRRKYRARQRAISDGNFRTFGFCKKSWKWGSRIHSIQIYRWSDQCTVHRYRPQKWGDGHSTNSKPRIYSKPILSRY